MNPNLWMALTCFSLGMSMGSPPTDKTVRPNIVFILADDLGYGDLSCYPHQDEVSTPNIDRLAASGVRMTQAYVAGPVCSPTRASFLTGRFPQRVGVYDNDDGAVPGVGPLRESFPPLLRAAGYRNAWFGKWHQGWDIANHPLNNGFDVAYGFLGGMHDYYDPAKGNHYIGGAYATQAYVFDGFKPVKKMGYLTEDLTTRAVEFIRQPKTQPFFVYLAYNAPHTPMQAPDEIILKHLKAGLKPREAAYRAMIDVLDTGVGRLLAALKECGLDNNTLVIFTSDNGAEAERRNGGLRGTKMTAWEGGVRIPLIASWPGTIPAGGTSAAMCSTPDLTVTFLELGGATQRTASAEGVNLMPFWMGKLGNAHEALVWSILVHGPAGTRPTPDNLELFAVRRGPWKVVRDQKRKIDALYNLDQDLKESEDVSAKNSQKKAELIAYGAELLKQCPPSCARIARQDTTLADDRQMYVDLEEHCRKLIGIKADK